MELLLAIGAVVMMARIASYENESGLTWGGLTGFAVAASFLIPIPYLRVILAVVAVFIFYFVRKLTPRSGPK